jgi:hypothetical protein
VTDAVGDEETGNRYDPFGDMPKGILALQKHLVVVSRSVKTVLSVAGTVPIYFGI